MSYKCQNEDCNWEGTDPASILLHHGNWEHEIIYFCPECEGDLLLIDNVNS